MVVKVRGLNIRKSKGKWYVNSRRGGECIIRGFEGTRKQLDKKLEGMAVIAPPVITRYQEETLGGVIEWFKRETIRWANLKPETKKDYEKSFIWLGEALNVIAIDITIEDIANTRNKAAKEKWPRFADKTVSALSSVFSEAAQVGKVKYNPCRGVTRLHKADPNANREWTPAEQAAAFKNAPRHILGPMLAARYAGMRGVDIQPILWSAFKNNTISFIASKNSEKLTLPLIEQEPLLEWLKSAKRSSVYIFTTSKNLPWLKKETMQQSVSRYLKSLQHKGLVGSGLTLHGLRVTYAAEWKRLGLDDAGVAHLIGDLSTDMGKHYTRHVTRQETIDKAFKLKTGVQKN